MMKPFVERHLLARGQFGRRVERDRSWTVYHVFTGAPADLGEGPLTGLSAQCALAAVIDLNLGATCRADVVRYARRQEADGTWCVFDTTTGALAEVEGGQATGMRSMDSYATLLLLNRMHPVLDAGTVH